MRLVGRSQKSAMAPLHRPRHPWALLRRRRQETSGLLHLHIANAALRERLEGKCACPVYLKLARPGGQHLGAERACCSIRMGNAEVWVGASRGFRTHDGPRGEGPRPRGRNPRGDPPTCDGIRPLMPPRWLTARADHRDVCDHACGWPALRIQRGDAALEGLALRSSHLFHRHHLPRCDAHHPSVDPWASLRLKPDPKQLPTGWASTTHAATRTGPKGVGVTRCGKPPSTATT